MEYKLTLEDIKACHKERHLFVQHLKNMKIDIWYERALNEGNSKDDALEITLDLYAEDIQKDLLKFGIKDPSP